MYYTKQTSALLLSLGVLLVIPACGPKYQSKQLKPLNKQSAQFEQTKDNVSLRVRKLSAQEADVLFDKHAKQLFSKTDPILPLQCSITNTSDKTILVKKHGIDLDLVKTNEVVKRIGKGKDLSYALIGVGSAALIVSAIAIFPYGLAFLFFCGAPACLIAGAVSTGFFIVATPLAVYYNNDTVNQYNKTMNGDISKQVIADSIAIEPSKTVDFLLFADGETFKPNFTFTVSDADAKKHTIFDVDLRSKRSEYLY